MAFGKKHFVSSAEASTFKHRIGAWYRVKMTKAPFLFFGLPFMATMVAGSFFLTPATAIRYEKHDRKVRRMSQEEAMGLKENRRKVDLNEEYYRLAAKDLDDWEQKRVERLPGENDGIL